MSLPTLQLISSCTVKPCLTPQEHDERLCHLTAWDFPLLSWPYIQRGLLFYQPSSRAEGGKQHCDIIDGLKDSLSRSLDHFPPLAGRLVTRRDASSSSSFIYIDCEDAGAEFIHAIANINVSDVMASADVHPVVETFFALPGAISHDGHSLPLFAVQLTELIDGFFIGCSFNHVIGDGSSFWHFFNSWAEIYRTKTSEISRPPVIERWFSEGMTPPIQFPLTNPDEFVKPLTLPLLRERVFHFTSQFIAALKSKANKECQTKKISSFQALMAHLWISMTRARGLSIVKQTACVFAIGCRSRLKPPLSPDYFGNAMQGTRTTTSVGELLGNGLGWVAWLLHELIAAHDDSAMRAHLKSRLIQIPPLRVGDVAVASSPRFGVYDVDFGWGKAVAVRAGPDNKRDGLIQVFPARDGGGAVDLQICLLPEVMMALESDNNFMDGIA